jgi:hypothetical protein
VRIGVASDGVNNTLTYRANDGEPFRPIITTDFRTSVTPQFFDFGSNVFYATSNRGRDKTALVRIDPARPAEEALVWAHPKVDLDGAAFSRKRKVLTLAAYDVDKPGRHYFDPATRQLFERIESKVPGYEINLQSATLDEDKFIVAAVSDRSQGTRYIYDAKADTLTKLGDISPWLNPAHMAPVRPVSYKARDGLEIPGYLTLPVGRPAKEPAVHRQPARRPVVPRPLGLQSRGAVPRQPRLLRAADELPRLDRLRPPVLGGELQAMGPRDAGRRHRRCAVARRAGHRRPQAAGHLWRQLRRLRHAVGHHEDPGPVRRSRQLRGRQQPVHLHEHDPAVLGAVQEADVRDGRQP